MIKSCNSKEVFFFQLSYGLKNLQQKLLNKGFVFEKVGDHFNYFYKIKGEEFRCPLAIMNGIFNTGLNRYKQVTDVVIAYNTWVDCKSPIQIGVGQNIKSADVLPQSEIRAEAPIRTIFANNIIYNTQEDAKPLINHHKMDGIVFKDIGISV